MALALLFSPGATQYLTQKALNHFLKVDANVTQARLSLLGYNASGVLNSTDAFDLKIVPLSWPSAFATLHYEGDVNTFSNVATVELPHIKTVLDATFNTNDLLLELNASLLDGTLSGDLSLDTMDYRYRIDNVDLTSFRTQQEMSIPDYATGALSANGDGIIEAPYTVRFSIQGRNLQLEKSSTSLIASTLQHPLPLTLELNGSAGADNVETQFALQSRLFDINSSDLYYDFNQSRFRVDLDFRNYDRSIAPVREAALNLKGSIKKSALDASGLLSVDGYKLKSDTLHYDFTANDLLLDYRVTSVKQDPLNLQGDYALFGDLDYRNNDLTIKMDSKSLNSPVLLTITDNNLTLISTNISLETLQIMTNMEVMVRGNIDIRADADLSAQPLLWKARVKSKNINLPLKYRKDLGLKNDVTVTINAKNEKNGDIVVQPALWSNIAAVNYSALRYKPAMQLLFFNLNATKVKSAYYQSPRLSLKGSFNLEENRLNKTTLTTPYDDVVINTLRFTDRNISGNMRFKLTRLDRFGSLNRDYNLSGKAYLHYSPLQMSVKLSTEKLGTSTLTQKNSVFTARGRHLPLEALLRLVQQPKTLKGELDYTLRYSPTLIKATISSKALHGDGDLERSIRPFSLEQTLSLKHKDSRYRGESTFKTDNESVRLSNIFIDLSKNRYKAHYRLDAKALEKSSYKLPKELKGPLHVNGTFKQDESQDLTLNLQGFQLPQAWHKKLDDNATSYLETNASLQAHNENRLITFGANVTNTLFQLSLHDSDYNLQTGDFNLTSELRTALWVKDTNISLAGNYKDDALSLPKADMSAAYRTAALRDVHYSFADQNLSATYELHIDPYPGSPYRTQATIDGEVQTKPKLYATMKSDSLGGDYDAYVTDTALRLTAKDLSVTKLIAFSGKKLPISDGTLNANIVLDSPSLLDGNLSALKGRSDINITNMVLEGMALDDSLRTLRDSQDLNLFEGSFSDLPIIRSVKELPKTLTQEAVKNTHFPTMRFLTDIKSAILHCSDCAVATDDNLIALKGDIDLSSRTFDKFYVGLLFPNNCAYFIQQIEGNLSEPQVELAAAGFHVIGGATKSLIGNVGSVIDLGADIIKGTGSAVGEAASYVPVVGERTDKVLTDITDAPKNLSTSVSTCTPFYSGTVKHPKPLSKSMLKQMTEKIEQRGQKRK